MSGANSRISSLIRLIVVIAVSVLAALTFDVVDDRIDAAPPNRKGKDDRVEELMERVHEGKRSPLARTKSLLAAAAPDWTELTKHAAAFSNMSDALTRSSVVDIRDSADGYADAVKALSAAVRLRDPQKARTALQTLTASCADCHYKGGPGGKLDDD